MTIVRKIHPVAGGLAMGIIACFMTATILSELSGDPAAIASVKAAIAWGLIALVPAMAAAGASGFALAKTPHKGLVAAKAARMKIIAANGLLVLVPAALTLRAWAAAGAFGPAFYAVQALELCAGALNIALMAGNMRDGLRMRPRKPRRSEPA